MKVSVVPPIFPVGRPLLHLPMKQAGQEWIPQTMGKEDTSNSNLHACFDFGLCVEVEVGCATDGDVQMMGPFIF